MSRWTTTTAEGASPTFPPRDEALVKAIAGAAVYVARLPLSRLSPADRARPASHALGQPIRRRTVGPILAADALKPWRYAYGIVPRDPLFAAKAGRVVDLYAGLWEGQPLGPKDHLLSADEKTTIQARIRCHPTLRPDAGRPRRVEREYERGGARQYRAAGDVRRGYVRGRGEPTTGIEPFGRLVKQVMEQPPSASGQRVFWGVDNGSSPRGAASVQRLAKAYPNLILVHTPTHARWRNPVEIYVSIIQRNVLTPKDFASLGEVAERLRLYEELSNQQPRPFAWPFERAKLAEFLARLEARQEAARRRAAANGGQTPQSQAQTRVA